MNETDARKQVDSGSKRLAAIPAIIGILAIAAPFVFGAHALWIALGVGIGIACFAAAVVIASGEHLDGPPPRRTG